MLSEHQPSGGTARPAQGLLVGATAWNADNPYPRLLNAELERLGVEISEKPLTGWLRSPDRKRVVISLHWLSHLFRPKSPIVAAWSTFAYLSLVLALKLRGARVIWTFHNAHSHEQNHPRLEKMAQWVLVRLVDRVVCLTEYGAQRIERSFGDSIAAKCAIIPHPTYGDFYGTRVDKAEAFANLGLERSGVHFLFFGRVNRYKQVPSLLKTFTSLDLADAKLAVVGQAESDEYGSLIADLAGSDPNIILRLERVDDPAVSAWFSAADWLVLPYHNTLNSGVLHLALTMSQPMILPDTAAFRSTLSPDRPGVLWYHIRAGGLEAALRGAAEMSTEEYRTHEAGVMAHAALRTPEIVAGQFRDLLAQVVQAK
ncbi:MAG: glycosyltransferase [Acidimicrobiia bacterium]